MKLSDVFHGLTTGELAQLSIGGGEAGAVATEDYPKLIPHIQLGLRDLHTRFPIKEREVTIQQQDNMSFYKLSSVYAVTNPQDPPDGKPKYIIDSADNKFTDDIIRIEQVFDENGDELPVNKSEEMYGAFTAAYNVIQFPQSVSTNAVYITYRADHPVIVTTVTDATTVEVEIPDYMLQSLLFFVASRLFTSVSGQDTSAVGEQYRAKYLQEIAMIERHNNLRENNPNYNKRIRDNGWA